MSTVEAKLSAAVKSDWVRRNMSSCGKSSISSSYLINDEAMRYIVVAPKITQIFKTKMEIKDSCERVILTKFRDVE